MIGNPIELLERESVTDLMGISSRYYHEGKLDFATLRMVLADCDERMSELEAQ